MSTANLMTASSPENLAANTDRVATGGPRKRIVFAERLIVEGIRADLRSHQPIRGRRADMLLYTSLRPAGAPTADQHS
jgi:hypothetical protein